MKGAVRIVVFGSTGTAGSEAVRQAASDPRVEEVVAVTRRPLGLARVRDAVVEDLADLSGVAELFEGAAACHYCLGISAGQAKDDAHYRHVTYELAMTAAAAMKARAPDAAFQFLSGQGTNAESFMMWARVKGETEEALKALGLRKLNCFRPGYIHPVEARAAGVPLSYRLMRAVYRPLRAVSKGMATTNVELGQAMLEATIEGLDGRTFENAEVNELAARYAASRAA